VPDRRSLRRGGFARLPSGISLGGAKSDVNVLKKCLTIHNVAGQRLTVSFRKALSNRRGKLFRYLFDSVSSGALKVLPPRIGPKPGWALGSPGRYGRHLIFDQRWSSNET
jgi:hypothetical protein